MKDALESVKVAEFDGYAAGRCIGKHLVDFGARVLHLESKQQPEFRLQYPPYEGGRRAHLARVCRG